MPDRDGGEGDEDEEGNGDGDKTPKSVNGDGARGEGAEAGDGFGGSQDWDTSIMERDFIFNKVSIAYTNSITILA